MIIQHIPLISALAQAATSFIKDDTLRDVVQTVAQSPQDLERAVEGDPHSIARIVTRLAGEENTTTLDDPDLSDVERLIAANTMASQRNSVGLRSANSIIAQLANVIESQAESVGALRDELQAVRNQLADAEGRIAAHTNIISDQQQALINVDKRIAGLPAAPDGGAAAVAAPTPARPTPATAAGITPVAGQGILPSGSAAADAVQSAADAVKRGKRNY